VFSTCCQYSAHVFFAQALHTIAARCGRRRHVVREPSGLRRHYWDFGTIFELVAAFFSLLGIFVWTSERRGWLRVLFASLALLLAIEGKEMAVTMPIIWLSYDLLVRKNMV